MSEESISLSRRKALGAISAIGIGSAAAATGTYAAFSDSEQDTGNDLETGDLSLTLDSDESGELTLGSDNLRPGDAGLEQATLENTGSLDGTLSITLSEITNTDVESEPNEPAGGQLSDALQLRLWLEPTSDTDSNTEINQDSDEVLLLTDGTTVTGNDSTSTQRNKKTADKFYDTDASSPSSVAWDGSGMPTLVGSGDADPDNDQFASYDLLFDWAVPETADGLDDIDDINAIMSDRSTFDFEFSITGA